MVRRGAGYTLIVCVVAVTVLSIAVATALPLMSSQIQREKEAELVFRGLQYAEAIRVFQRRFGRLPSTLQELVDARPRSIRRLWKDPITEEGTWVVLVAAGDTAGGNRRRGAGGDAANPAEAEDPGEGENPVEGGQAPVPVGPVIGVRSRSDESGFRTFFDVEAYASWRFTSELLNTRPPGADGLPVIPRAAWIGKAFRKGVSAPPGVVNPNDPEGQRLPGGNVRPPKQ